ncbi:uncharacterized protein LOC110618996 [Manihot esculenta]|uniref:uncharacterized protein LOC110618996 n=1 Tax=Manihot esculenta TaxID=3983 RepID=UPI000B5D7A0E|nr:uncharacterized protein LOC110618996 [Manihot esculenta]
MQVVEHSSTTISFSSEDAQDIQMPHDDALVIEAIIHNYKVKKVLVDDGSKVNLLPYRVYQQMGIPEEQLIRDQAPIKGIGGTPVTVEGKVKLALTLGEAPRTRTHHAVFLVAKLPLSYNAILGRLVLFDFEAVTSIRYLAMKFPTEAGVGTVQGSQKEARAVYLATVAELSSAEKRMDSEVLEVRDEKTEAKTEPVGELETFSLSEAETDKAFSLNAGLTKEQKAEVMSLIRGHASSFAWKPSDMPGIDPGVMAHRLNVLPEVRPVKQKKRVVGREKQQATKEEVQKLEETGFIREVMSDEEKTSFITEDGTYCYRAMPFGLKNAGATYQRLMNKIFKNQIGRNVEVYVDDMVVKSLTFQQHMVDLKEVFGVLDQYRMKLNPAKCAFFIRGGKFLGYMVSGKGIEPNPEKVEAILNMAEPTCAVSAVLVRVEGGEQKPVFYASKVLKDAEVRYLNIEKIAYALLLAVRKFRVYLESHQGVVMTDQPLKKILHRPETSGRMLAWSVEIGPYCLEYRPRTTIKSQALADFIAECTFDEKQGESSSEASRKERKEELSHNFNWKLYVDGASGVGGSGAGVMLKGPGEFKVCYALRLGFKASNNVAEYEALINGMLVAIEVGATDLEVNSDSQLVINQVTGAYQARDPTMQNYLAKVKAIEAELTDRGVVVKFQRIPREENEEADLLSRLTEEELEQLPDEAEQTQTWMTPYLEYLEKGKLPENKDEARKIAA